MLLRHTGTGAVCTIATAVEQRCERDQDCAYEIIGKVVQALRESGAITANDLDSMLGWAYTEEDE